MLSFPGGPFLRALALVALLATTASSFGETEVGAIVGHTPDLSRYGDPGGIWMGRDLRFSIDGAGNISTNVHNIARVVEPTWGKEHLSPLRIHYWAERQAVRVVLARVWKNKTDYVDLPRENVRFVPSTLADGATAYETMRMLEIDFSELEHGDVIELRYECNDRILPGEFNIRWFTHIFGDEIATVEERLTISAPSALGPYIEQVGPTVTGYRKRRSGFVEQTWTTGHLNSLAVEIENSLLSRRTIDEAAADSSSQLVFATSDWQYMSKYFGRFWGHTITDVPVEMRQKVGQLTEDSRGAERARAIERWIQTDIETLPINHRHQGLRPQAPSLTYNGGRASSLDKTMLLLSALRIAGINGSPVLVRTRQEPWQAELGCPDQLDRFLVRVSSIGDETLWLDPLDSTTSLPETVGWIIALPEFETDFGIVEVPARE